jgi:hypothetical protein
LTALLQCAEGYGLHVALFEIESDGLVPFNRVIVGPDLYEKEIEDLLWDNLEEFTGTPLFPLRRQPPIAGGGRPDIVALDESGHVVVIEVKRDIDRAQLAQCLEYAGWARTTNLEELANVYHAGPNAFFTAWQEFTGTDHPVLLQRPPQLVLVARDLHDRTESALGFLADSNLPVAVLRATIYADQQKRRFIDIAGTTEKPALETASGDPAAGTRVAAPRIGDQKVTIGDLIEADLLRPGDELVWDRPRMGEHYKAWVTDGGALRLESGHIKGSPSGAAMAAAKVPAYDGWIAWRVPRLDGRLLADLRLEFQEQRQVRSEVQDAV